MSLSNYLTKEPFICINSIDYLDRSASDARELISVEMYDSIDVDERKRFDDIKCFLFSRTLETTPSDMINLKVSFKILCNLNEEGSALTPIELIGLIKSDKQILSICTAKASLLISQITSNMATDYPIITPPQFLDDDDDNDAEK